MSSRNQHEDDDDEDDEESGADDVIIKALPKERSKLLISRGVPGQDMVGKSTRFPISRDLVKMEPNIPKATVKVVATGKQLRNLLHIMENPLKGSYTLGIGSYPSDMRAKQLAITIMNAAVDAYLKNRPRGRTYPLWHRVYGSLGDPLRDRPITEMPSMLIISNVNMDSTNVKLEKVRDLLEKFSEIPRIVITGGEPPVDLFANKLHYPMRYGAYVGPPNRVREA